MSASPESASKTANSQPESTERILVSGLNWLGDSVMSMPAIRLFRQANPSVSITVLSKPVLLPIWRMHPDVDEVIELEDGFFGARRSAEKLKQGRYSRAYVLPNSFRSALVPYMAGIPERIGMSGHCRSGMLTKVIEHVRTDERAHQMYEYYDVMGVEEAPTPTPLFPLEVTFASRCRKRLEQCFPEGLRGPIVGMFPGAARGISKMWPTEYFGQVAHTLVEDHDCRVVLFGSLKDGDICQLVRSGTEMPIIDFSGQTTLPDLAGVLEACDAVLGNDSGGCHLAAAVGTPTAAIFGITDPAITGPIGSRAIPLSAKNVKQGRDLPRDSVQATAALTSIKPAEALKTVLKLLE